MNHRSPSAFPVFLALLSCAVAASSCALMDATVPSSEPVLEGFECGTLQDAHTLDGIHTAGQPSPEDFEQARQAGVRTVLNVRFEDELEFDERTVVEGLGMGYVHVPWSAPDELTDETLESILRVLNEAQRPLLYHCGSANRVGATWFVWRVLTGGLDEEAAMQEARKVGLRSPAYEERVRAYVAGRK